MSYWIAKILTKKKSMKRITTDSFLSVKFQWPFSISSHSPQLLLWLRGINKIKKMIQHISSDSDMLDYYKSYFIYLLELIETYGIEVTMQQIPGRSNICGNDIAHTLAKMGSRQEQPHTQTTYETVKQIIRSNFKEDWLNEWATFTFDKVYTE